MVRIQMRPLCCVCVCLFALCWLYRELYMWSNTLARARHTSHGGKKTIRELGREYKSAQETRCACDSNAQCAHTCVIVPQCIALDSVVARNPRVTADLHKYTQPTMYYVLYIFFARNFVYTLFSAAPARNVLCIRRGYRDPRARDPLITLMRI